MPQREIDAHGGEDDPGDLSRRPVKPGDAVDCLAHSAVGINLSEASTGDHRVI